jgi:hypothetical protein
VCVVFCVCVCVCVCKEGGKKRGSVYTELFSVGKSSQLGSTQFTSDGESTRMCFFLRQSPAQSFGSG